jgi:hypothetical protein
MSVEGYWYTDAYGYRRMEYVSSQDVLDWVPIKRKPPTKKEARVLASLHRHKEKRGVLKSNKVTHYRKRRAFAHTQVAIAKRRQWVEGALKVIASAKKAAPQDHVRGRRRRSVVAAWEVQAWLASERGVKFSLRTLSEDMRALRS